MMMEGKLSPTPEQRKDWCQALINGMVENDDRQMRWYFGEMLSGLLSL